MRPGPGRDTRRDDCSQRHCPHRMTRKWDGHQNNRITRARPPAPVSRSHIIGLPAGHLKDASGAATAAGLRPVPDPPGRSPRTWQLPGNRRRQLRTPAKPKDPRKTPLDTAPLLQG